MRFHSRSLDSSRRAFSLAAGPLCILRHTFATQQVYACRRARDNLCVLGAWQLPAIALQDRTYPWLGLRPACAYLPGDSARAAPRPPVLPPPSFKSYLEPLHF
eukprot:6040178-Pleurochrysis_carterae.AAC.1